MNKSSDVTNKNSTNVTDPAFRERITMLIERVGGPTELAKRTGLSRAVIDKYKNGESDPSRTRLLALAEAGEVSLEWLAGGDGDIDTETKVFRASNAIREGVPEEHGKLYPVPVISIVAGAGNGALVLKEEAESYIGFDPAWLRTNWNLSPNDLFTIPTIGESMEPTVKAGEFLLCSRSEAHLKPGDGIYVIRLDGHVLVKRLQLLPGGKLMVSSDNDAYKPYEIVLDDGIDFAILGKVVLVHGLRRV